MYQSQSPCPHVFISRKMKANTFSLLFTDLCKAFLIIAFRRREKASLWCHPPTAVRQQGGQRSAEPLANQPVAYLCLRPVSELGYREHVRARPFAVQPVPHCLCSGQTPPLHGSPLEEKAPQEKVWQGKEVGELRCKNLTLIRCDSGGLVMTLFYSCSRFAGHSNWLRWEDWCLLADPQPLRQLKTLHGARHFLPASTGANSQQLPRFPTDVQFTM